MCSRSTALILAVSTVLGACARDKTDFPSLARRPAERITGTIESPPLPPPAPLAPAVLDQIDTLVAQAKAADERFAARIAATRQAILAANGAAVASEAWSGATIALSALEATRSEALIGLAELDRLYAGAVVGESDSAPLSKARDAVQALIAEQDRVLEELQGRLAS